MECPQPIGLEAGRTVRLLAAIAGVLLAAHICGQLLAGRVDSGIARALIVFVDVNREGNLPTLFSALLYLFNVVLFYCAWRVSRQEKAGPELLWPVMAGIFLFLGIDEVCTIHERVGRYLRNVTGGEGLSSRLWVIPYGIAAAAIGVIALPVIKRLGQRIFSLIALAGTLFVSGAIGLEVVGGLFLNTAPVEGIQNPTYIVLYTIEEALEMAGLIMLAYALMVLIRDKYGGFSITLETQRSPAPALVTPAAAPGTAIPAAASAPAPTLAVSTK